MAEVFTGKLSCDKGKWKIVFFDEKKQRDSTLFCQRGVFSTSLKPIEAEETEVDFERDATPERKAIRVRLKGTEWQAPTRAVQANPGNEARGAMANQPHLPAEFHNPYNFIPAPPRAAEKDGKETLIQGELDDREPSGHDRYHADKFSGKLRVNMRVETPLLLPDTARMHYDPDDEHKSYPVKVRSLLDEQGNIFKDSSGNVVEVPDINPTAIKGMLRSAYEAVTNSRLSVFREHAEQLAFRAEVKDGLIAVPVRIESGKIVFYTGQSDVEKRDGGPKITGFKSNGQMDREPQYAAWINMYEKDSCEYENGNAVFKRSRRIKPKDDPTGLPAHGRHAWAWIREFDDDRGRFKFWKVDELAYDKSKLTTSPPPASELVDGYICITGKTMKNKHDERFFFGRNATLHVDLEEHHIRSWNRLIKNYREEHKQNFESPPREAIQHGTQRGTKYSLEWSRHIQRTAINETSAKAKLIAEELKDGTLCYARVQWNDSKKNFDVIELYPVMIPRRLHKSTPAGILPECLHPAQSIGQLSPADRVFGWVRQSNGDGVGAYRGQLRIGGVECSKDAIGSVITAAAPPDNSIDRFGDDNEQDSWLPLQILGQPKPQQGRFYVAQDQEGNAQPPKLTTEEAGYMKEPSYGQELGLDAKTKKGLRGRKVYPHHANLPDRYWIDHTDLSGEPASEHKDLSQDRLDKNGRTFFREYIRPNSDQRRDNQNRSIQGWVKPGVEFAFEIHFINLSDVELGALIWLLTLNEGLEEAKYFHRFGGGKPLGFGSVSLNLDSHQITSGGNLKEFYGSLDATPKQSLAPAEAKTAFENAYLSAGYQKIIEAFKRACQGFADGLPSHYPRARHLTGPVPPHKDGLAYEWFVENAKEPKAENRETRLVLEDLVNEAYESDKGLPILKHT